MTKPDERPTPETVDILRQKLRVAERVKQAAIDCTKSWDNILDELVWERPDIDAHEIPAEYLQTMVARYPHHAEALTDFAKRWNSDKPLSDEELADMEVDEESVKRTTASCLMMLKWSTRIRKAEAERDQLRVMWERDSKALGVALGHRDTARAVAEDNRALWSQCSQACATLQGERDALREANIECDRQLSRVLHELAGAASLCWKPKPSGVFDTTEAITEVERAITELRAILRKPEALLDREAT